MKTDAKSSVSGSDTTSPNAPASENMGGEKAALQSEAEFLKSEAMKARAAIGGALVDLRRNLQATADPHVLTRDHPWIAISTAAAAGFAAAVTLIPSKEQQALRALAELERARHAPPPPPSPNPTSDNSAAKGGMLGTIIAELVKTVRPMLTALVSAGIANVTKPGDSNGHAQNGAHGGADQEEISTPS
jgi:hypothetical protein